MEKDYRSMITGKASMVLFLGACPALAASSSAVPALAMGLTVCCILVLSSVLMGLLRKVAGEVRLMLAIMISAGFASIAQMLLAAFLPKVYAQLGVYVAVVAVNAMVIAHQCVISVESDSGKNLCRSVVTGLCFCAVVTATGIIREVLGSGTVFGAAVPFFSTHPIAIFSRTSGAFIVFAILLAVAGCFRKEAK